jgi:CelD/BcsL family acetyltransferase involved in cellulose biosynthesis
LVDHTASSVFHSPDWIQVVAATYDLDIQAYVALDETGLPRAGIPFCRVEDFIGKRIVALPFSDYTDPLSDDSEQWNCLANTLLSEGCPVIIRCLHNSLPLADKRLIRTKQAKWHGLDLKSDLAILWSRLHDSSKRAIKKAEREGVMIRAASRKQELRAFFDLHLRVRKYKYRLLAQPYHFFEQIWQQFIEKGNGLLLLAIHQGELIGGTLLLVWKSTLYYKFNASAPEKLSHRPNDMLIWEGMKIGKARGYTCLDFGLSDEVQEGLVRFKRKFASEEKAISFVQYIPNELQIQQEREARGLLAQLTTLFTDELVPDCMTEMGGNVLYRFFT